MNTEKQLPGVPETAGGLSAPKLPETPRFSARRGELIALPLLYVLGYLYFSYSERLWLGVFTLGLIAVTELLHWEKPRSGESWFWLGCLLCVLAGVLIHEDYRPSGGVWDREQCMLFLHLEAVWWILHRSGTLLEGESGHLLPADGLNGFIIFPFRHFFLRLRCLWDGSGRLLRRGKNPGLRTMVWSLGAVLLAGWLFFLATRLLQAADESFDRLVTRALSWLEPPDWEPDWLRLILSLPVGAWLFGLVAGTGREEREALDRKAAAWRRCLMSLAKVPDRVWSGLMGAFCLLYLLFFALQAEYLFGAFTRTLPEGFVVSRYARQGFFELCQTMAVNFALLWLVTRLSRRSVREDRINRTLCLALLGESLLLALVALSKLALYIDCFGFTPLRLQSSWLVCVLILGCLCAGFSLLSGRKSFRLWLMAAGGSLSLLCLL